jgi:hypothetical protein
MTVDVVLNGFYLDGSVTQERFWEESSPNTSYLSSNSLLSPSADAVLPGSCLDGDVRPEWFSEGECDRVRVLGTEEEEGSVPNEPRRRTKKFVASWADIGLLS